MDIGVSEPPNVSPNVVVSVSTSPGEFELIGLGVSPVDIVGAVSVEAGVSSIVERREIGVPAGLEPFSPPVVPGLGIGLGVSPNGEGSLVVPWLDIGSVGWVPEMAVDVVIVFIGLGVSPTLGFTLISWVVMKCVVCGSLDVTLEVPPVSIGLGVSSWLGPPVDPWPVPCVGIIVDIIPVFVGDQDAELEVSVEGIGFGVSPVGSGPSLDP